MENRITIYTSGGGLRVTTDNPHVEVREVVAHRDAPSYDGPEAAKARDRAKRVRPATAAEIAETARVIERGRKPANAPGAEPVGGRPENRPGRAE